VQNRGEQTSDMAAHGEKIDELFKIAHTLTERVDGLRVELRAVRPDVVRVNETVAELSTQIALLKQELVGIQAWKDQLGVTEIKAEVIVLKEHTKLVRELVDKANLGDQTTEVALLRDRVKKLQDAAEKRGNRAWSLVPNLTAALVSGLISAIVALLRHHPQITAGASCFLANAWKGSI
jgi:predicted  nucleic acid-binding Zn-ribbon protein